MKSHMIASTLLLIAALSFGSAMPSYQVESPAAPLPHPLLATTPSQLTVVLRTTTLRRSHAQTPLLHPPSQSPHPALATTPSQLTVALRTTTLRRSQPTVVTTPSQPLSQHQHQHPSQLLQLPQLVATTPSQVTVVLKTTTLRRPHLTAVTTPLQLHPPSQSLHLPLSQPPHPAMVMTPSHPRVVTRRTTTLTRTRSHAHLAPTTAVASMAVARMTIRTMMTRAKAEAVSVSTLLPTSVSPSKRV
ncbi:hypothetical protein BDF22DRAFT_454929 [Syncephalis plumigaleata]|nr:hypothetical protein BDF22DRAFT_454929 [Syncephalis plumigaleata]